MRLIMMEPINDAINYGHAARTDLNIHMSEYKSFRGNDFSPSLKVLNKCHFEFPKHLSWIHFLSKINLQMNLDRYWDHFRIFRKLAEYSGNIALFRTIG